MPFVEVDGDRFHYRERGRGDSTVVFVHPYMLDSQFWLDQLRGLGDARRCIAIDLRGHGESEPLGSMSVDPARDAADVNAILDALGVGAPVHFVGAAVGGTVAALAYLAAPRRVRTLTFLSTIFMRGMEPAQKPFFAERARNFVIEDKDMMFRRFNEYIMGEKASLHTRARYKSMLHRTPFETIVSVLTGESLAGRPDVPARLAVPVCVPYGSDDITMTPERREGLIGRIPDLTLKPLPEGGRLLPIEFPQELNAALREFWAGR